MSWLDTLDEIRTRDFSKAKPAERDQVCRDLINTCSYAAAVVAVVPLPFSDALLSLPIQSGMVLTIGHVHGRKLTKAESKDLALELGALAGAGLLARTGIKALLPVVGPLLTVPAAFAASWAIGRVATAYFQNPAASKAYLKKVYADAIAEGKARFSKADFDRFRKKNPAPAAEAKPKPRPTKKTAKAKTKAPAKSKPTAKALVEVTLAERIAARKADAKRIGKIVHLKIAGAGGGTWTVDLSRDERWIAKGLRGEPDLTVRAKAADFVKVATGALDAAAAVMDGALELEPLDAELAQAFGKLLAG